MDRSSLSVLIEAYRDGELSLPALLVDALAARGAVPAEQHAGELQWLARMREEGRLDAGVAQRVGERLEALQRAGEEVAEVLALAHAEEATCVAPALRPAAVGVPADQATVVQPASVPAEATGTGLTGSRTAGGTGSVDAAGWQQLADVADGERATIGMLLKGRFLIEREIGRGGMGVVFLARDERKVEARDRDPYVAVKVLNDEFRRHPDSLIALQRESRRSQQLAHDNIVRVYDFDKHGTIVFMTMEYVDGSDLKTLIREGAFRGLPLARARPLIEGMARALTRAHGAGVVHSDFKPGNVMVSRDGVPKVFDFGIARAGKQPGEAAEDQTVFDAGRLGALTPAYASLEMIQGRPPQATDDIYALGCVAFELLTGKHPFDRVSAEVALREGRKPPPVPGLTRRQYRALCDAVAFTADRRLKSAELLVEGLREVGLGERMGRPLAWSAVVALLLAVAGWAALGQWRSRQLDAVAVRFQQASPHPFGDEAEAAAAIERLGEEGRQRLMLDQGDQVQQFLLRRVDAYWNPTQGRRNYAAAERVFELPARLHLFLPRLDLRRAAVEKEKLELERPAPAIAQAAPGDPAPATSQHPASSAAVPTPKAEASQPLAPSRSPAVNPASTGKRPRTTPPATPSTRMQDVAANLRREGERNFRQQNYSAAMANAKAALQLDPGDAAARRLLRRAEQAQQQAMNSISIN